MPMVGHDAEIIEDMQPREYDAHSLVSTHIYSNAGECVSACKRVSGRVRVRERVCMKVRESERVSCAIIR